MSCLWKNRPIHQMIFRNRMLPDSAKNIPAGFTSKEPTSRGPDSMWLDGATGCGVVFTDVWAEKAVSDGTESGHSPAYISQIWTPVGSISLFTDRRMRRRNGRKKGLTVRMCQLNQLVIKSLHWSQCFPSAIHASWSANAPVPGAVLHTANTLSLCPDLVIIEIWGVVHFLSSNSLLFPSYIFLFLIRSLGLLFNIRSDEFPARPLLMEVIDVILVTESWVINNEIFNLSKRNNG